MTNTTDIERVGYSRGGSEYQTIYFCCGMTVEGDGDDGLPDSWCFEGMHTVSQVATLPGGETVIRI